MHHTLPAGAPVYTHSGPDGYSSPPAHLLWNHQYLWNNEGDEAVLYDGGGLEVDRWSY